MKFALLNGAVLLLLAFSGPAFAQEAPAAGDSCTAGESGYLVQTGGPEDPAGDFLVCDGSTWNRFLSYTTDGIMRPGEVAAVTLLPAGGGSDLWTASGSDIYYSTGKVGIGTTSPASTLEVKGDSVRVAHVTSGNSMAYLGQRGGGVDGGYVDLSLAGVSKVGIDSNGVSYFNGGNVGIGTASPGAKLELVDSGGPNPTFKITTDDGSPYAMVVGNDTVSTSDTSGIRFWVNNDGTGRVQAWKDGVGSQHLLFQPDGGNVGIGTTSPETKLHIGGVNGETVRLQGTAAGAGNVAYLTFRDSAGAITGYIGDSAAGDSDIRIESVSGPVKVNVPGGNTCVYSSGTSWSCSSDERLKERIRTVEGALEKITAMRGVTYHWRHPDKAGRERLGVVAQEVERVFPQAVEDSDGYKTVDYGALVAPLIEAVKELDAENDRLEAENDAAQTKVDVLERRIEALEAAAGL